MKEGMQTIMEGSRASQGTSGTQALCRPEVLLLLLLLPLPPHTPFMLV